MNGSLPRLLIIDTLKPVERSFMRDLIAPLDRDFAVRFLHPQGTEGLAEAIADADVVWFEWCAHHAAWATRSLDLGGKRVVIRLHSTEIYDSTFPQSIPWEVVDHLILVGEDIRGEVEEAIPGLAKRVEITVIANGVDCTLFRPGRAADPHAIGWVGDVAMKKNPMLALQIIGALVEEDPRYHLHMAGAMPCRRTARYLAHQIAERGLGAHVSFHGPVSTMPAWYRAMGALLSTTLYESFGLNILEAMASGCRPVVHNYPGAGRLWPREILFNSVDEAVALLRREDFADYRAFAETFDLPRQIEATRALLSGPPGARKNAVFDPAAYWDRRHGDLRGQLRAVAHQDLDEAENRADYEENLRHLIAPLQARFATPQGVDLLDCGCGSGHVAQRFAGLGFSVRGVDFSPTAVDEAAKRVPGGSFQCGSLADLSEPPARVVLCLDVLFHVLDDAVWRQTLDRLAAHVVPGGVLLILEHFPEAEGQGAAAAPGPVRHVRWRSLAAYQERFAALGLTLAGVDVYRQPASGAMKTLMVVDRLPEKEA
ncbi:glycosyltransferase [Rhodospirillum rubrum]|uniref:Glycosyl transferase, group 1 n=1 Tax=Rhodospirillum rubrum (strain ATCC 11170 / ATH 1.1.1 / DSM 467 / LMG 4362 / NCIMB 8255 / S1) TaxID=269796 RepID=Q2RQR0_RHORT|nr:methyltransferase domain-containing protein [Rhodospirillum rubrum]ABC23535.1 Glycosyl transferase, group 1 [Rhodospirillum rubrum ATCC 11170]AEO49274.1 glycosyl transferase, group 1 [Rhodospirillum rubrum F11]MBK5955209.1 glycosyl transferase family 1 [Rhodospirillum rubrum]QXG79502.1 glycosyltransferase [Rhodospirillum rubrum]HAQ01085.1 glycosyl transferase family 1 [Rhodospirillum rubrum]